MRIHHIRNATFIIESGEYFILIDPMLGDLGTKPPFTFFRFKARKNPLVALPDSCKPLLEKVTHCFITHKHPDHIDNSGIKLLKEKNIPVICSIKDADHFREKGLNIIHTLRNWQKLNFLNGSITGIPATHGHGFVASLMGDVIGFYIKLESAPSIYISADTIYTIEVDKALKILKPDITVVACGMAQMDFGKPILMGLDEVVGFARNSPNKVIANHLEALNHCPVTRKQLRSKLLEEGLLHKVYIPMDGESIELV